jgi:hydroxymethylglutaryl-CoA lyase
VMAAVDRPAGLQYAGLVMNLRGVERALEARCDALRAVVCVTEAYNQRNIRMSIADTLTQYDGMREAAACGGIDLEVAVALAFGCPLEGAVAPSRVYELTARLAAMGFRQISIADSVGLADPLRVFSMMTNLTRQHPGVAFSLHFHDTRGLGLANVLAGLQAGVTAFDSSLGGLGGCPVVPGGTGNIATEDLVNMLDQMGVETGVDSAVIRRCTKGMEALLQRPLPGRLLRAGTREELFA